MAGERRRMYDLIDHIVADAEQLRSEVDQAFPAPIDVPTVKVPVGESVQTAYDALEPTGGIIQLEVGTHLGELRIRERPPDAPWVTITSDSSEYPPVGSMITPEYLPALGVLQGVTKTTSPIRIQNKAHHVAFVNIGIGPPLTKSYSHVEMGGDKRNMLTPEDRPDGFLFDRCYIFGDPVLGGHRGITLNASNVTVSSCYIKDIFEPGRDSQAVSAWNGGQYLKIENCFLEGGAENVMFGGSDCASPEMACSDILISRCHLSKNYAWMSLASQPSIKCLFEIKSVKRLRMEHCLLECNWKRDWSTGVGVMLKACNQEGGEPTATCEDVVLENLVIRNVGSVFGIIGKNDSGQTSDWMRRVAIRNVLAYDINQTPYLGTGRGMPVANGVDDGIVIDHVTYHSNSHSWMNFYTDSGITASPGPLAFQNSMVCEGSYGYLSATNGIGFAALKKDWPHAQTVVTGNCFKAGSRSQGTLPPDNIRLSAADWEASLGPDHMVLPGSPANAVNTTDGTPPGASFTPPARVGTYSR